MKNGDYMIKNIRIRANQGFTLLEIVVVLALMGLILIPMVQLIYSIFFTTNKENIKADLNEKGRTVLEGILFDAKAVPTTEYIGVYDDTTGTLARKTGAAEFGTALRITDLEKEPNTSNPSDIWYRIKVNNNKKYLLKYQSIDGEIPIDWEGYIYTDRISDFKIIINEKGVISNKVYDKYLIQLALLFGEGKNKVEIQLDKTLLKYIDK